VYDETDPVAYRPRRSGSPVLISIFTSALTSAAVFFALRHYFPAGADPSAAMVDVPPLVGLRVEQARELLDGKGLILTLEGEKDDADVPAGAIVSQAPLAGSRARGGGEVRAVVSRGLSKVTVPDVGGLSLDQASQKLVAGHLEAGTQMPTPSASVPLGQVVGTSPKAGTEVAPRSKVEILLSSGPAEVEVPKVTGLSSRKAKETLEKAGFQVGTTSYSYDEDRAGYVVLRQDPAAGQKAAPGAKINLVVNEGD